MDRFNVQSFQSPLSNRRDFLARSAAFIGFAFTAQLAQNGVTGRARFSADPFRLGVASGDPLPDSIILWTRLAPDPLHGGGMPRENLSVEWQVATDDRMQHVVKRGQTLATPELAHSVHVEVRGLQPSRWYWYQFKVGSHLSPIGRTRTAPARDARTDQLTFAFASCQQYEDGYYTAYRHMVREELDLVVFLGDYIYEGGMRPGRPRQHNSAEVMTLTDYRNRYALYKSDPDLQLAHATFPWVVTWDDHEVENNYAGAFDENGSPPEAFLRRRADAYQAYYEHMPLRLSSLPRGPNMRLYRQLSYGALANFHVLDTRQYRTDQPCGDGHKERCAAVFDPRATMMGPEQEQWLMRGLDQSHARWNIIAQQVMMSQTIEVLGDKKRYGMDNWNGYVAARNRLLSFVQKRRPANPVVLTGDIHSNWVADLKADFDHPPSETIATEFVGTSITSGGDGADQRSDMSKLFSVNPHIKFYNGQRGYVRCHLAPERWQSDYRVVEAVSRPGAQIRTRASFIVENGKPGAQAG